MEIIEKVTKTAKPKQSQSEKTKQKISAINKKLAQLEIKKERLELRRTIKRKALPSKFPSWEDSKSLPVVYPKTGLSPIEDDATYNRIVAILDEDRVGEVLKQLGALFGLDKAQVCLLHSRTVSRKGESKLKVMCFRTEFNRTFKDALKATNEAVFDRTNDRNFWNVPLRAEYESIVTDGLNSHFPLLIDLDSMHMRLRADSSNDRTTEAAFTLMPYHRKVNLAQLHEAISKEIDASKWDSLLIHDGTEFVELPDGDDFYTRYPFLVIRCTSRESAPKLASYSTLANIVESVGYIRDRKSNALQIMARFHDSFYVHKEPVWEVDRNKVKAETDDARSQYYGLTLRLQTCHKYIRHFLPDIAFFSLLSNYVSLSGQGLGADIRSEDIAAYVIPAATEKRQSVYRALGEYFGVWTPNAYPIIFSETYLRASVQVTPEIIDFQDYTYTILHELSHHLCESHDDLPQTDDIHGVEWAVYYEILLLLLGLESRGSYTHYHPQEKKLGEAIIRIVQEQFSVVFPELSTARDWPKSVLTTAELRAYGRGRKQLDLLTSSCVYAVHSEFPDAPANVTSAPN